MATGSPSSLTFVLAALGYLALFQGTLDIALLVGLCGLRSGFFTYHLLRVQSLDYVYRIFKGISVALVLVRIFRAFWTSPPAAKWDGFGKVLLFPCQTTHSRLFPKKHSFAYSYLVVGIPVGWEGVAGGLVSAGVTENEGSLISSWFSLKPTLKRAWFDTNAGDYLERGKSRLGLRGKLDEFLRTQVRLVVLLFFVDIG